MLEPAPANLNVWAVERLLNVPRGGSLSIEVHEKSALVAVATGRALASADGREISVVVPNLT
jgi:hypothetical protein